MFTPSQYQQAVFNFIQNDSGNLLVDAKAGSGKTKTIIECMGLLGLNLDILFVCFNKSIAKELQARIPPHATASTLHSFGNRAIKQQGWAKINGNKVKNILLYKVYDIDNLSDAKKKIAFRQIYFVAGMIGLLKAHLWMEESLDQRYVEELAEKHGNELPTNEDWFAILDEVWRIGLAQTKVIDFDDMIFLPLFLGLPIAKADMVFVDESQDLNPAQIEMVSQMGRRVVAVGDPNQAIYGFRGADADAMNNLREKLDASVLPLSICYRCSEAVIKEAQKVVPEIEVAPSAVAGSVETIEASALLETLKDDDFVLCRCTAPLVCSALAMIRAGRRAVVLGRDIGDGLLDMISKITDSNSTDTFLAELDAYSADQEEKLLSRNREAELIVLKDKVDTLKALAADAPSVKAISVMIKSLFSEEAVGGVTFSTIHKSKGLEAQRVFILRPDLLPHPMAKKDWMIVQEQNLKYVAITRALEDLFWVN